MNIIFGRANAAALSEKYTILELDTIQFGNTGDPLTVFCAVDNIPIMEMPRVESMKSLHENLIIEYRKQNWNYCTQALEHLVGFWNQELDTYYNDLTTRIEGNKHKELADNWWIITKNSE